MMEELLRLIAEVDEEADLLITITETIWSERSLRLRVEISVEDDSELGTWIIRCERALNWKLSGEGVFSLDLVNDHPLLWAFKYPSASAYFFGVPSDANACVGALYETHTRAVSSWIRFGSNFNRNLQISRLLSTGNGLLAWGPMPLLSLYKEALLPLGVEISILNGHAPRFWDGATQRSLEGEDVKALLLGTSYVVGIGWTSEQVAS